MHATPQPAARLEPRPLDALSAEFAGQIATAVWLEKLSDDAAREALWSYAMACHSGGSRHAAARLLAALTAEYRRRRERQDACC